MEFELSTRIAAPAAVVFAAALDIDLHLESMAGSRERAVAGVTSGRIGLGEQVTWRAWHFGLRWRMTTAITALDAPRSFTDEQVRGPFARFRHEHHFEEAGAVTVMRDRIVCSAPGGPVGRLAERLVLAHYLRALIEQRNRTVKAWAEHRA